MEQPNLDEMFSELNIPKDAYREPSQNDQLEAARTALGLIRLSNGTDNQADMYRMIAGLDPHEIGFAIASLAQFGTVAVHCMAALNSGISFDEQIERMQAEIEAGIRDH